MYVYLYDSFVTGKKYEAELARVETRIAQLGLRGPTEKLSILKNVRGIVRDAVRRGAETFVVVGNDDTMAKVVSLIAQEPMTLGFIPLGPKQGTAELLGIPVGEAACDILSKRLIRELDLGKVNDVYFLFSLELPKAPAQLECDSQYVVSATDARMGLRICNVGYGVGTNATLARLCDPQDGVLEAVVTRKERGLLFWGEREATDSVFPIRRARIHSPSESLSLLLDGQTVVKTPATVEVAPRKLRVIVGRKRKFT